VELASGLAPKEEDEQLVVARRLERLVAPLAQPAMLGCAMHRAEHRGRAQRGRQLLDVGGVVEVANIKRGVMGNNPHIRRQCRSDQCRVHVHVVNEGVNAGVNAGVDAGCECMV